MPVASQTQVAPGAAQGSAGSPPLPRTRSEALPSCQLVDRYAVRGKRVVEIACGSGEFLSLLCTIGGCEGVGFDPSYVASRAPRRSKGRVEVRTEHYSEAHARIPADLICCRHALEHLDDPLEFLRMLRRGLGERRDTVLYFEVPNATWILDEFDLWDLIYEHFAYFCRESLVHLFRRAGFQVLDAGDAFDRQFLWVEARAGRGDTPNRPDLRELERRAEAFAVACQKRVDFSDEIRTRLRELGLPGECRAA